MSAGRGAANRCSNARGRLARTATVAGVLAALMASLSTAAASAAPLLGVDLSSYARVGRFDLPEPTRTVAPVNSKLAQEASGVAYSPDTDSLFIVGDGSTSVVQVDKAGNLIDSMTLALGSSPQGTEFYDTEGITYVGGGRFVLVEERDRQAVLFTYVAGTTLTRADVQTVKLGTTVGNIGLEGISSDPQTGGFIAVKESGPKGIFQTGIDFAAGTASNGSPTTVNPTDLFDAALSGVLDHTDVFALSNLSTLSGPQTGNLLVLSQESGRIINTDRAGNIASALTIASDPGNPRSVPDQGHEGLTMDDDGNLYVVSEEGGGDIDHPQLWVYAPSAVPNQAPSAVTLTNQVNAIVENTSTVTRIKVAGVAITDDGLGTNNLSLTGPDAASFEVDSTGLYIKAGTVLDYETKTSYGVTVNVDDATVGAGPDASAPFTITVTDVVDETPDVPALVVTEVSPWSSGNSPYAADWFEVTNTESTAVDITGFKVDDSSNAFASAIALTGVTSIPAGQSVIFIEGDADDAAAFKTAWFGTNVPIGFQIGTYSGGGIGLSTGGDAVQLFDAAGNRVTGVSFGTSTSLFTFDNAAGEGSTTLPLPTISTLSAAGRNGAFVAGGETGSPGTTVQVPIVSETSPWSSGSSPYGADWFEVTNTGTRAIEIGGWKVDDSSNAFANAIALTGVSTIAAGKSVIFIEGDAARADAFKTAWFGSAVPAGLQIGTYSGGGIGLSTGGDAVQLFDALGNRVTGISFGASTDVFTFDNAAGLGSRTLPLPAVTTLSVVGVNGAYRAGLETGSPGTIAPDTTAPTVTYSGNAGTYTVDQQVNITCAAADEPQGSGIASTTCANVTGPAASFGLGSEQFSATATDNTGNVGSGSGSFTVTVTPVSLCALTKRYVQGSAKYQGLTARQKLVVDRSIVALCEANLTPIKPGISPAKKKLLIALYKLGVNGLAADGWLTKAQAAQLSGFTSGL